MGKRASVRLVNTQSISEWAERIRGVWQDNVTSIFELGKLLEQARAELGAAEFAIMIRDELKYSQSMVSRLMIIADNDKLLDYAHAHKLPPCWYTLYELTKLTHEQFESGVKSGVVHAGMERKDIKTLKPEKPKPKPKKREVDEPPIAERFKSVDDWCGDLIVQMTEAVATLPDGDRAEFISRLRDAIVELEKVDV